MIKTSEKMICIGDYPELTYICWTYKPDQTFTEKEVLSLYEASWRYVEIERLTDAEKELIIRISNKYGCGEIAKNVKL